MRRNPALRPKEEPDAEERYVPIERFQGNVPPHWIHITNDVVLDAVLADGKTKRVLLLVDFVQDSKGRMQPLVFEKYIRKGTAGGYDVWGMPFKNEPGAGWTVTTFRNMADLVTSPRSVVGMALRSRPKSTLYYVPGTIPTGLPEPETPAQTRARIQREQDEALAEENRMLAQAEAAMKRISASRKAAPVAETVSDDDDDGEAPPKKRTSRKNPLESSRFTPDVIGKATVLRTRRFNEHYGEVFLARLWDNGQGNYAVWADDSNTMADSGPWRRRYGYPATFDLKYYQHYPAALEDYLTRRTLRRPVPLGGR